MAGNPYLRTHSRLKSIKELQIVDKFTQTSILIYEYTRMLKFLLILLILIGQCLFNIYIYNNEY